MKKKTFFWVSVFAVLSWAPLAVQSRVLSVSEAPIRIERGAAKRLFIVGFAGQVILTPVSKAGFITVSPSRYIELESDSAQEKARSDDILRGLVIKTSAIGDLIEIRAQLPPIRSDWARWAQGRQVPQVKLEIAAPDHMSLEIYWTRGDIKVARWKAPVGVTSQEGKIVVEDVQGDVILRSMFGSDVVQNIHGALNIENFSSVINVTGISGKTKVRTFSGETHLKKIAGPISISSQKAPVHSFQTNGPYEIQTGVAAIHVVEHQGIIRGHSQGGPVDAHVEGPVDAQLSSTSGPLSLHVSRRSHADVSLSTEKGEVNAPKTLEHKRSASGKIIRGTLGGSEAGRIRLSSESGDLSLKVF